MPRLHYSNRLECLIEPLSQQLEKRDPFDTVEIVVPNFSLERWISLKLAQFHGIAANLHFITLENAINEGLKKKLRDRFYTLLKPETTHCIVLEVLREKLKTDDPLWQPVRSYITTNSRLSPEAREHRLYQLAGRLTYLFMEYELSRNDEIITSWMAGRNALDPDPLSTETWQRELWTELFGPEGNVTRHNHSARKSKSTEFQKELYTLPQIYRFYSMKPKQQNLILSSKSLNEKLKPLHIFGVSYLSRFHQKALTEQLSNLREVHVYTLNPCMEFWEDVQSLGESKGAAHRPLEVSRLRFGENVTLSEKEIELGELFEDEEDNPFLQAWGLPGRENIKLLNQWSAWTFEPWFSDIDSEEALTESSSTPHHSVLSKLQQDILFREPRRVSKLNLKQDESIVVLACANPRREVEAVGNLIWHLIRKDQNLKLNECALIVNDMKLYQHEIEQVFESIYSIPYHLIDGVSGSVSRLEDAAISLLGLCFTEYTRRDVFSLINNPCFLQKFEDNSSERKDSFGEQLQKKQWLQWADELNIFYGIDRESQKEKGYLHLEYDIYNWEQAFHRLTLGEMVSMEESEGIYSNGNQQTVPFDFAEEWSTEAARFILIVRSLIADTRDLPKWELCGKDWGLYLETLLKTYLKPIGIIDEEVFQNLLKNVRAFSDLDLGNGSVPRQFSFNTIFEFFKQKQQSATVNYGNYLAEGITVSSFKPMRPIPFKAVFLLGMGEGLFPTPYQRDTLDLRHIPVTLNQTLKNKSIRERRLGDVSVTERDRYMFLETLVSTKKHLVLSYVSRNDRTDDELNPSSIIQTLIDELDSGYLKEKFEIIRHPLKPYSLDYFPELSAQNFGSANNHDAAPKNQYPNYDPAAFRQARAFRIRELFDLHSQSFGSSNRFHRISPDWLSTEVRDLITTDAFSIKEGVSFLDKKLSTVTFSRLRKFLESPLQSTAGHLLGLSEDEKDVSEIVDEPLVLERMREWLLLRKVWNSALNAPAKDTQLKSQPEWNNFYQLQAQRMELQGIMPTGIFRKAMQNRHLRILKSWEKQLNSVLKTDWCTVQKNICQFNFGAVRKGNFKKGLNCTERILPQVNFKKVCPELPDNKNMCFNVQGETEWWYKNELGKHYVIHFSERESKDKVWLRHFIDVLVLLVAEIIQEYTEVTGLCITGEGKLKSRIINLPSRQKAQDYLVNLLYAMNTENAAVLMPVESVLELTKENLTNEDYNSRFKDWMDSKLNSSKENLGISSQFGPVKFLNDVNYPENPFQLMNSRFNLFFETVLTSKK